MYHWIYPKQFSRFLSSVNLKRNSNEYRDLSRGAMELLGVNMPTDAEATRARF